MKKPDACLAGLRFACAVLLAGMAQPALADFQSDPTPVDLRAYYPNATLVNTYRRYDGSIYVKRVTRPNFDPMASYLPDQTGIHFSRDDYLNPVSDYWSENPPYDNSWSFRHGSDMSVTEVADAFPVSGGLRGQFYLSPTGSSPSGITHGRPGGHVLGEDYHYLLDHYIHYSGNIQTQPFVLQPSWGVWSALRLVSKHNSYAPTYGSNVGSFGPNNGRQYQNVVAMFFVHGTKVGTPDPQDRNAPPLCESTRPSWATHRPGYTSFWQTIYLAPGIGEIEEITHFDERSCNGAELGQLGFHSYIDTSVSRTDEGAVDRFYRVLLRRPPDAGGFAFWVGQLRQGCPSATAIRDQFNYVTYNFIWSGEHQALNLGNQDYVRSLYEAILGRKADSGGLAYWTGQLDSGASTRESIRAAMVYSGEFFGSTATPAAGECNQ